LKIASYLVSMKLVTS